MKIIPVIMVRNEEIYIQQVLAPLATAFEHVLLADTGSNDTTVDIAERISNVQIVEYGLCNPEQLTDVRRDLGKRAVALGADMQFLVDGDELYSLAAAQQIAGYEYPANARTVFTTMVTLDLDENNQLWELDDRFSRQALLPANDVWHGIYPFDTPSSFDHPSGFFYLPEPPNQKYHAVHLHRLIRSRYDKEVLMRDEKRYKFSLQDKRVPRTVPFDMPSWYRMGD